MRQRQISDAERSIGAKHREAAVNLPAALDPDQATNPPRRVNATHLGRGAHDRECLGIASCQRVNEIDLLKRPRDLLGPGQFGRDPD